MKSFMNSKELILNVSLHNVYLLNFLNVSWGSVKWERNDNGDSYKF